MARLHLAGADYALRRPNALSVTGWKPLVRACEPKANTVHMGLGQLIVSELRLMEQRWPADLPEGLIHADLFPDNVFFLDGQVSGLIDFFFAATDLLAYDVAVCLNAWCFEPDFAFNITKGQALLRAYDAIRPLTPAERAALPVLCQGAALRFALTRLYDWINTPPGALVTRKDPMDYVRRLRFHLQAQDEHAYGL
jgi:homoserine kinase type II